MNWITLVDHNGDMFHVRTGDVCRVIVRTDKVNDKHTVLVFASPIGVISSTVVMKFATRIEAERKAVGIVALVQYHTNKETPK